MKGVYLNKYRVKKGCKTCCETFNADSLVCSTCKFNPHVDSRWLPSPEIAKKIVMHYMKQKEFISTQEIATNMKISSYAVIENAIKELVKEGKLKTQTTVVVVK